MAKNKKVAFPKSSLVEIFDCNEHEICGLDPTQEKDRLTFTFWRNPSRLVLQSLIQFLLATPDELRGLSETEAELLLEDFYNSLSKVIIDTNIEGLDFSTPDAAKNSYIESPELPMGFVHETIAAWLLKVLEESLDLGKVLRLLSEPRNTGKSNENDEEQS